MRRSGTRRSTVEVAKEHQQSRSNSQSSASPDADEMNTSGNGDSLKLEFEETPMQTAAEATAAAASSLSRMPTATPSLLHAASLILPGSSVMQQHKYAGVGNLGVVSAPTGIARFATMPHGGMGGGGMMGVGSSGLGLHSGLPVAPLPAMSGFVASGAVGAASPPSSFSRQVSRLPSAGGSGGAANGNNFSGDWRALVSVEERINIRRKLRESYLKHCPSYQELIDTATAVDEELLFACSTNRIDFFKSSIDWDSRIQIKCQQLKTGPAGATAAAAAAASNGNANGMGAKKRSLEDAAGNNLSASSTSLLADIGFNNADLLGVSGINSVAPVAASSSVAVSAASLPLDLHIPTMSQLRGATLPAASLPATKEMADLLVAAAADAAALQPNKKQRS